MGRTKTPKPPARSNGTPSADEEILTLEEAAAYLRVSETEVIQAIEEQGLPVRRVGAVLRFSRVSLRDWVRAGEASAPAGNAALMALAGKYQEDPDLLRICEEAYRMRRESAEER